MKTLVIHPKDTSTDFLEDIYSDKDWAVCDWNPSNSGLKQMIKDHDRIIMLGHGTEHGLLGFGRYIIDSDLVYLLREKICVAVWCYAQVFFEKYKLNGLYTGMIISELEEANINCIHCTTKELVSSNILFSYAIKESVESLSSDKARDIYKITNGVTEFNNNRIFNT